MNDSAASYFAAIKACRLLGLLRAEVGKFDQKEAA